MSCPVKVAQLQSELDWLVELYQQKKPRRVLEIGSLYGGTLWHWMKHSDPGTQIVVVDYTIYTDREKVHLIKACRILWDGWAANAGVHLKTIFNDSTQPETVAKVAKFAPFDFVFVDGGHIRRVVNADFENYWPMVAPGGLMAFHDIASSEDNRRASWEVGRWWREVIQPLPIKRIEKCDARDIYGIGVLEKE